MLKKIIIDTDPGVDDSMAILLAFNSPELEVVGLTTVYGNVTTENGTQNALRLVEFAGHPNVPVAHGAELPLQAPLLEIADMVHGADGLGNTNQPPPRGKAIDEPAAQFIVETIMRNPGEITLVPVGPLTNIALALRLEPRIVQNVAGVIVMGGAATVNGNVSPAAEANIWHDPHAADVVFTAGWPVTMVGLDVTEATIMTEAYLQSLKATGSRTAAFIYDITRFYQKFHFDLYGVDNIHTHDPSAIMYALDPTLFTTVSGPMRVLTEGIAIGQTILDRRELEGGLETPWSGKPPVNVCVGVDSPRLLQMFKQRITAPSP